MKSKTKTILIFAAILAAVFLIAFLDGGAVQSAADEEEEGDADRRFRLGKGSRHRR